MRVGPPAWRRMRSPPARGAKCQPPAVHAVQRDALPGRLREAHLAAPAAQRHDALARPRRRPSRPMPRAPPGPRSAPGGARGRGRRAAAGRARPRARPRAGAPSPRGAPPRAWRGRASRGSAAARWPGARGRAPPARRPTARPRPRCAPRPRARAASSSSVRRRRVAREPRERLAILREAPLEHGQDLVAQEVAVEGGELVGLVLDPVEPAPRAHGPAAPRAARRAAAAASTAPPTSPRFRHRREPLHAGAAQRLQEHGLGLVVAVVRQRHEVGARPRERRVPRRARRRLEPRRMVAIDAHALDDERHAARSARRPRTTRPSGRRCAKARGGRAARASAKPCRVAKRARGGRAARWNRGRRSRPAQIDCPGRTCAASRRPTRASESFRGRRGRSHRRRARGRATPRAP